MKNTESSIQKIELSKLTFDPLNPRIPRLRQKKDEKEIIRFLITSENLIDLIISIGEQDFFPGEPLLVTPSKKEEGVYEVVEGNRRLAALKLLQNPELAPVSQKKIALAVSEAKFKPSFIPVIIYPEREMVLDYLGYRHISGVERWDSLQKARFLSELWERHYSKFSSVSYLNTHIAKLIGSRSDHVNKLVLGYKLFTEIEDRDYYGIPNLNEETFSFSLLTTAVSYKNIKSFIELDEENENLSYSEPNLEKLIGWLFEKNPENEARVPESRALKTLNAVVGSDEALKRFEAGQPLQEAVLFTDEPRENFLKTLKKAYNFLQYADSSIHHVNNFEDTDLILSEDSFRIAKKIHGSVKNALEDQEEDL